MEWYYVFNRTQCGTDLGLIKTKAIKQTIILFFIWTENIYNIQETMILLKILYI